MTTDDLLVRLHTNTALHPVRGWVCCSFLISLSLALSCLPKTSKHHSNDNNNKCVMSTLPRRRYDKPTQYIFFSAYLKTFRLKFTIVIGIKCVEEMGDHHGQETGLKCDF